MAITVSRRSVLKTTIGAAIGGTGIVSTAAQTQPAGGPTDRFFRDDWFGEPWRNPEVVVLIHGALESGVVWFAWLPALAKGYRVLRPDLPGCGLSTVPSGFEWSFPSLAGYIASVLDKAGIESAHIVGAKTGGPVAMQFAADFPARTRSLCVVSGPASVISITNPSPVPQQDRLGSGASADMIEYWNAMEKTAPASGHARTECGAIELRPRKRWRPAAHRGTLADHHGGQKRAAIRREGAQVSDGDTRFAARRATERRVSHRRRESGRVRRQRACIHPRARLERLAVQRRKFNAWLTSPTSPLLARSPS